MHLIVERIYNARRLVKPSDDEKQHYKELREYLTEEVNPQGFKYERIGNELVVIGYCGKFEEDAIGV